MKNKELEIIVRNGEYINNKSQIVTIQGIDDIDFTSLDYDELELTAGTQKIIFQVDGACVHDINL